MTETIEQRWRRHHRPGSPGKIDRDTEIRAFVDGNIYQMTYRELALECRRKFGPARAPSKTAIAAYWKRTWCEIERQR